jgi:type III pantothenate kinase
VTPDIVVDVGNSRIKWGRCAPGRVLDMASLPHDDEVAWQVQAEAWGIGSDALWGLSGVSPRRRDQVHDWLRRRGGRTVLLDSHRHLPLEVCVDQPDKVGLDRLLNAVAVNSIRGPDAAAIIIDAGTAVTVDYVDDAGGFQGGAIMPGLRLMAQALHDYTALLPRIEVTAPGEFPGKNTEEAMRSGVFAAVIGGVETLRRRLSGARSCEVFLGGGDAGLLAPHLAPPVRVWPEITLEGIRCSAAACGLAQSSGRIR